MAATDRALVRAPPARARGLGGGCAESSRFREDPHPDPPPPAGEGAVAPASRRALGAAALVLALASLARADDRASAGTYVYTDSDGLTVVHPSATASARLGEDTRAEVGYDADVITAATVDVRTSASVRPFEEVRHGARLGASHDLARTVSIAGSYALSIAPDHEAHGLGLGARLEDDDRNHRLAIDLRGAFERVGRAGDLAPTGEVLALGGALVWTSVVSSWLVVDLEGALEWRHGYLESPYRFVTILGADRQSVRVPEEVPDDRARAAVGARLRAALTDSIFARARYRLHGDDWGVVGHTVELEGSAQLARGWIVSAGGRLLVQRGASFYRGSYATLPELPLYRTRDRELAPGFAAAAGVGLEGLLAELPEGFRLVARARGELLYHRFFDTPLLPERVGVVAGLTLSAER